MRSEEVERFAARIRALKDRAKLSFEELARRTGASSSSLHRYCSGTKVPSSYGVIHVFAKACGGSNEELRELHRLWALADAARFSAASDTTITSTQVPHAAVGLSVLPRQVPAAPGWLIGRTAELARLSDALDATARQPAAVAITAITGAGGIGKTALAVQWAHQNIDRFPDGQLFVNLRGFDPSGRPLAPAVVIRRFLDALGVEATAVPHDLESQVGLYRSLVAGKRMLIMLDNAYDTAQITPMLPGSPTCTVIVTSRDRLTGLVTAHGAHPLTLDVLDVHEARALLAQRLGRQRLAAEPDAAADLLTYCAGLPLALSLLAGRAQAHPDFPLAVLATELRDTTTRLSALEAGDPYTDLDRVLSWSYAALTGKQARVFGLLGMAPGPDISLDAAAELTGLPASQVRGVLRALVRVSLVDEHMPGRYGMHDLTRLSATEQAKRNQPRQGREAALRRLADFYLHTARTGEQLLNTHHERVEFDKPVADCHPYPLADHAAALRWFDAEHPNLLAIQQLATERGWHHSVSQLAWAMSTFHFRRGYRHDQFAVVRAGLAAADHLGDPCIQSRAHRLLGDVYVRAGRHADALHHLQRALALAKNAVDRNGEARTHHALARAWEQQGHDQRALEHTRLALPLFQALQDPVGEADSLNMMGWYSTRLGRHDQARPHLEAALTMLRRHYDLEGQAATLDSLAYLDHLTGHHTQALQHYRKALTLYRESGNAYEEANTVERLGQTHAALGQHDQARDAWKHALHLYQTQHRSSDAERVHRKQLIALPEQPQGETQGPPS